MNPIYTAIIFLINTVFDIYLFILVLRFILVLVGSDYFNPLVQFVAKLTDFLVKPIRRIIPNTHRIEWASLIALFVLLLLKFMLLLKLSYGSFTLTSILILTLADTIRLFIQTFFYALIIQIILSWVQPYSPINTVLNRITIPILRPFQRLIPPIGGFDISPIPVIILLQLLLILVVNPLTTLGLNAI